MRRFLTAIALAITPLAAPQQAFACSCVFYENESERFEVFYENADIVLQGTPIEFTNGQFSNTYSIGVEKVWKGNADAYIDISTATDSAMCGVTLQLDAPVVIFATKTEYGYETGLCSGTTAVNGAQTLISWLSDERDNTIKMPEPELECTPYQCKNGEIFPACTNDGHQINYLVAPCQFSGGNKEVDTKREVSFTDVPAGHPNEKAISFVKQEGIVQGYADGTYRPDQQINRAEFTKIITVATLGATMQVDNCAEILSSFTDIDLEEGWYTPYICAAKSKQIIDGYPDNTFRPGNDINFAEAAKIVVNAFSIESAEDNTGVWWKPYVYTLARIGGLPSSFSDPNQPLTRGDMAEIIFRVMIGIK